MVRSAAHVAPLSSRFGAVSGAIPAFGVLATCLLLGSLDKRQRAELYRAGRIARTTRLRQRRIRRKEIQASLCSAGSSRVGASVPQRKGQREGQGRQPEASRQF